MAKGPTWNDINQGTAAELKKTYKLTDRQLEVSVRDHGYGIKDPQARRDFYESVYNGKRKS